MQRIVTSTDLGEGRTRHRVRIESDVCETGSGQEELVKRMLLQNFSDNPQLLTCGMVPFQSMKMYHTGTIWIIEAEAITESPNAKQLRSNAPA